ncbi:MAG: ribonuclease P protein component [Bacteroidetes bacterium MedPE-SWsnd-G2]|nr:MAG: ribonuclease P protein component [Bacteroidetes bacterium MedPE-SWsnd-G2]
MKSNFPKSEKLKSKTQIEHLFSSGQSVIAYPLRLVFLELPDSTTHKTGVSVSKRNFKTAVSRNRIKRLLRESYRLNKASFFNNISTPYAFMILYIGKEDTTLEEIDLKMKQVFKKFSKKIRA